MIERVTDRPKVSRPKSGGVVRFDAPRRLSSGPHLVWVNPRYGPTPRVGRCSSSLLA